MIRSRRLPAVRIGKYLRVQSRDLKTWIEGHREK
jgi:excisionase family DNA binding protein